MSHRFKVKASKNKDQDKMQLSYRDIGILITEYCTAILRVAHSETVACSTAVTVQQMIKMNATVFWLIAENKWHDLFQTWLVPLLLQ